MLAYRALFSILARSRTNSCVHTKPLTHLQFFPGVSCGLRMAGVSGVSSTKNVTQSWRPLSTQANCNEATEAKRRNREKLVPPETYSTSMNVGQSLMRFIQGRGGSSQKEIEDATGVTIVFPRSKNEDFIRIEGTSAESVAKASEKVRVIIDQAVNGRLDYSHFVSLPLAIHPALVDKLIKFQSTVLGIVASDKDVNAYSSTHAGTSDEAERQSNLGIEKSIFIKPKTFHLTVLMLKLYNKDRVKAAAEVLQSVSPKVMDALENKPLSIKLKGLRCMTGSVAKARVVYAPVEEIGDTGRLLHACQVIRDAFAAAGLVIAKDAQQDLKLHATVMNARHRIRRPWSKNIDSFDARGIFDLYGREDWGVYSIREAHLSQRFAFDKNGYYHCCASIPFPA